jgi:uncharacterized membrane protein YccC
MSDWQSQESPLSHSSAAELVTGSISEDALAASTERSAEAGPDKDLLAMPVAFRPLTFALANSVAVLAALYVAFAFDLERPYWAMFTVFIVANPIAGAVRSKAVYRFVGTFAGAAVSLLLVPPLVDAPVLLCITTSLWVGACIYLSLQDRTPRSYTFLLAGYTATLVGLAVVDTPVKIFDTAVSRVEEISLGVICAAVAHSLIFPRSVTVELNRKIQATLRTAGAWLSESLMHLERPADISAQQQLATVVTDLHLLYTHVAFETSDVPRAGRAMRLLQERLARLLPHFSSIQKAVAALTADGHVPDSVVRALEATSRCLRCGETPVPDSWYQSQRRNPLEPSAADAEPLPRIRLDWHGLLEQCAFINLRELVAAFADCKTIAMALKNDRVKLPAHLEREAAAPGRRSLHRDRGLAFLSAVAAAAATLVACLLWIEGSWPEGAVAAQFAAIGCSLSATLDNPAKMLRAAVVGILLALPLAALYAFAILPRIDGFVSLALVLSPAIMLFSLMQSSQGLGGAGLILAVAFSGGLALQSTYRADFAAFVNSNSAEIVGLLVALAMNLVFRTIDPAWNALRIFRSGRRAVSQLAGSRKLDLAAWTIEMFDRLGLVTSRMRVLRPAQLAPADIDELRDLRVGLNVGTIREVGEQLGSVSRSALQGVLKTVSRAYGFSLGDRGPRTGMEKAIDRGITAVGEEAPSRAMRDGLAALTGLRLDLAAAGSRYTLPQTL